MWMLLAWGGREELSGVLGGSFNFASNSATRAVSASTFAINSALTTNAASNCVQSAMISASLSASEIWPRLGSVVSNSWWKLVFGVAPDHDRQETLNVSLTIAY
jgi:hypothetical protein